VKFALAYVLLHREKDITEFAEHRSYNNL